MLTFAVLLLAYVLSQFFRAFLAIVAGDLARDIGLNARQLGDLSAIWFATFAVAQFPVGVALDRFGARATIAGFMVLAVAGAAWFAAVTDFSGALGAMALIGIGCSPVLMGSLYVFGRAYPPERFAMMVSLMIGFGSAGNLLGAAPLAWAVAAVGWRTSMTAIAAVTALSCILVAVLLREPPRPAAVPRADGSTAGLRDLLGLRALWLMAPLTLVGYAFVIAIRSLWIAPFLQQTHGFDAVDRGEAALAMAASMSVGALAYGPVERMLGSAKATVVAGSVLTALPMAALGLFGHLSGTASVLLFAAIGAFGMTYGILMAHARTFFPPELLGRGVTLMNFVFIAGAGVVQWISGRFVKATADAGWAPADTFSALHLGFAAVLAASTAIYLLAPARPPEKRPA
jgi:predicted MFS family arabinose efflux permease